MFQAIKRMGFLSKANFKHWDTGDGFRMYTWLEGTGWPASKFVDMFMRCHVNYDPVFDSLKFKLYLEAQYMWVIEKDRGSLEYLAKTIDGIEFRSVDKARLCDWVNRLLAEADRK